MALPHLAAELNSLRNDPAFRRLLDVMQKRVEGAKVEAIMATEDPELARGRARGMMEMLVWITPE